MYLKGVFAALNQVRFGVEISADKQIGLMESPYFLEFMELYTDYFGHRLAPEAEAKLHEMKNKLMEKVYSRKHNFKA